MALFVGTIFASYAALPVSPVPKNIGLDFIAFYTAGQFVRDGRTSELYDLPKVKHFQHELALGHGVDIGEACGPWWNPPFYALLFVPLAMLPYPVAVQAWIVINLLCVGASSFLLCRLLAKGTRWQSWALVPVLIGLSTPLILATTHGQNTGMSLLLLTIVVTLWRSERGLWAGIVGGLLLYKPQLGSVVALVLIVDLGWKAAAGYAIAGALLMTTTVVLLPGSLGDWLHRMPQNLHAAQTLTPYLWERHVTFKAFWRLLIQGNTKGEARWICNALTALSSGMLAIGLARVVFARQRLVPPLPLGEGWGEGKPKQTLASAPAACGFANRWSCRCAKPQAAPWKSSRSNFAFTPPLSRRERGNKNRRDSLISATILGTPLIVPFYFDYDLLLLAIPAVLFASELMAREPAQALSRIDRWLLVIWPVLYLWLMLNPDVAERTRVNLAVVLLTILSCLSIALIRRVRDDVATNPEQLPAIPRAAA